MGKGKKSAGGPEGARRATGGPPAEGGDRGRWSSKRKAEAVLRVVRGEDLDTVSRELGVTAGTLAQWHEAFLAAGQAGLKSRATDQRDAEIKRLQAKVGELTMDQEVYEAFLERLPDSVRPPTRRSRR